LLGFSLVKNRPIAPLVKNVTIKILEDPFLNYQLVTICHISISSIPSLPRGYLVEISWYLFDFDRYYFKILKKTDVQYVNVPRFTEFNIREQWNIHKTNPGISKYLPDYSPSQVPDREFFFNVRTITQHLYYEYPSLKFYASIELQ
jgi:hypothetical protein